MDNCGTMIDLTVNIYVTNLANKLVSTDRATYGMKTNTQHSNIESCDECVTFYSPV
jgi:hypothetical protein